VEKKILSKIMVKTLIVLILLFDGTLLKESYELSRPMEVHECLLFADDHREAISTYKDFDNVMKNGWYLNDGRGTVQGFICSE
jgi:hypothetical protein